MQVCEIVWLYDLVPRYRSPSQNPESIVLAKILFSLIVHYPNRQKGNRSFEECEIKKIRFFCLVYYSYQFQFHTKFFVATTHWQTSGVIFFYRNDMYHFLDNFWKSCGPMPIPIFVPDSTIRHWLTLALALALAFGLRFGLALTLARGRQQTQTPQT